MENKPVFPLVSVISPCFNGERYLKGFLDSVLQQSYPHIELILVDDASTDHSVEIAQSYEKRFAEKGITYQILRREENRGAAAAINVGLKHYHGQYMMWADSDDILLPDNISEKVRYLEAHPEKDYVLCQMVSVNENDLDTPAFLWKRTVEDGNDPMLEDLLLARNVVYGQCVVLVRRTSFEKAIPSNSIYESRQGQNYQLLFPLAYCCRCGYIDKVLAKYVVHDDSHSNAKRSFEQQITRQKEFVVLERKTLSAIPGMTEEDFARYMKLGEQQLLNNELRLSLQYARFGHYYLTRKKLKTMGMQVYRLSKPVYFYGRIIKRGLCSLTSRFVPER